MRLAIVGGGAWGTALAVLAAADGAPVTLWAREAEVVAEINALRRNTAFLPGIALPASIEATSALQPLCEADAILMACPAQHMRAVLGGLAAGLKPRTILVSCAKGIERGSDALLSDVIGTLAPMAVPAVLSGPSFATEVARGLPTAVTLAIADKALGQALVRRLGGASFRPYLSDDLIGAQIGGAVKNVLAIACGIAEGRGLGHSARAALITRGFAEMLRFAVARGARSETLHGLSGLGDLVLTCSSEMSRNFSLGVEIGRGGVPSLLLQGRNTVAEGAFTASALIDLAATHGIEMPIAAAVDQVLTGTLSVPGAIEALMARPFTEEN